MTGSSGLEMAIVMAIASGSVCLMALILCFGLWLLTPHGDSKSKKELTTKLEEVDALRARLAVLGARVADLETVPERVEFVEQLLLAPARGAPALPEPGELPG